MDYSSISEIISNVGFPIACCVALFWKVDQQDKNHKEEIKALRESLDNNTNVLTKLYERLTMYGKE